MTGDSKAGQHRMDDLEAIVIRDNFLTLDNALLSALTLRIVTPITVDFPKLSLIHWIEMLDDRLSKTGDIITLLETAMSKIHGRGQLAEFVQGMIPVHPQ